MLYLAMTQRLEQRHPVDVRTRTSCKQCRFRSYSISSTVNGLFTSKRSLLETATCPYLVQQHITFGHKSKFEISLIITAYCIFLFVSL